MSNILVPVAIAGGGIIYVLAKRGQTAPTVYPPTKPPAPTGGTTPGATVRQLTASSDLQRLIVGGVRPVRTPRNSGGSANPLVTGGGGNQPNALAAIEEKLHAAEDYVRTQFANMNDVGKGNAAQFLNEALKLEPKLSGHESWQEVSAVVGAWAAGAVGYAIGGPLGAKVGALLGAYLGIKLEEWINNGISDVVDAIGDIWNSESPYVSAGKKAYEAGLITNLQLSLISNPYDYNGGLGGGYGIEDAKLALRNFVVSSAGTKKPPYRKWPDVAAENKHGLEHYAKRYAHIPWPGHRKGENPAIEYPNDW